MRYLTSRLTWAEYLAVKIVNLGALRKARRRQVNSPLCDFKAVGNTYYNHIIRGLASAAIEVSPSKERQR